MPPAMPACPGAGMNFPFRRPGTSDRQGRLSPVPWPNQKDAITVSVPGMVMTEPMLMGLHGLSHQQLPKDLPPELSRNTPYQAQKLNARRSL